MKKQAVVNPNLLFVFRNQEENGSFTEEHFFYENGISDYVKEIVGNDNMTSIQMLTAERKGRDREDKPEYKVKLNVAFTFSNKIKLTEFYHNSSFLEYGGSPEKAVRYAFTSQIDSYLKNNNKYLKNEAKITYADIEDCPCSCFQLVFNSRHHMKTKLKRLSPISLSTKPWRIF